MWRSIVQLKHGMLMQKCPGVKSMTDKVDDAGVPVSQISVDLQVWQDVVGILMGLKDFC